MEAIEAVLELAKERDELTHEIETYEGWFEGLVGKEVTLALKSKRQTRFVECLVSEFNDGEGWELVNAETDEVYMVDFADLVNGKFWVKNESSVRQDCEHTADLVKTRNKGKKSVKWNDDPTA